MTPTTRANLLALWSARPETRPEGLEWNDPEYPTWMVRDRFGMRQSINDSTAAALAVAKLHSILWPLVDLDALIAAAGVGKETT